MRFGNPNIANEPYAPMDYLRSPYLQPGQTNPYGFGMQRVAGELAVQPRARGAYLNSLATTPITPPPAFAPRPQASVPLPRRRLRLAGY